MYYVSKAGEGVINFLTRFNDEASARDYATRLHATFGHKYEVIKVEVVWATKTKADLKREGVL